MRVDPNAEWCQRCSREGHSEPSCPFVECVECDGIGKIDNDWDGTRSGGATTCPDCRGRGYHHRTEK